MCWALRLYTALNQKKVIREAALRSGVSQGVMQACWDAAGEGDQGMGDRRPQRGLPGLGTMRFGVRAKAVEKVEDVKSGLISSSTHHLHSQQRPEGGAEGDRHPDYLLRPQRRGGEARDVG